MSTERRESSKTVIKNANAIRRCLEKNGVFPRAINRGKRKEDITEEEKEENRLFNYLNKLRQIVNFPTLAIHRQDEINYLTAHFPGWQDPVAYRNGEVGGRSYYQSLKQYAAVENLFRSILPTQFQGLLKVIVMMICIVLDPEYTPTPSPSCVSECKECKAAIFFADDPIFHIDDCKLRTQCDECAAAILLCNDDKCQLRTICDECGAEIMLFHTDNCQRRTNIPTPADLLEYINSCLDDDDKVAAAPLPVDDCKVASMPPPTPPPEPCRRSTRQRKGEYMKYLLAQELLGMDLDIVIQGLKDKNAPAELHEIAERIAFDFDAVAQYGSSDDEEDDSMEVD